MIILAKLYSDTFKYLILKNIGAIPLFIELN